jgi:hypothetical protein
LEVEQTINGATLVGYIDVSEADAPKIGTAVRETSIYVQPSFIDGHGNQYSDVPLHVALVTHAVQPGQKNFEKVPSPSLAIAMSQRAFVMSSVPQTGSDTSRATTPANSETQPNDRSSQSPPAVSNTASPDLGQVIQLLRQCGIVLPQDTNDQNFLPYLVVALGQKSAGDIDEQSDINQPPEGAQQKQPAPVAMSSITPEAFASITREVFMSHPVAKELVATNQGLLTHLNQEARKVRRNRIDALVASGRITKEYADSKLVPMVEAFQMSLGSDAPQALDVVLDSLEALPAPQAQPRQQGAFQNSLLNNAVAMSMSGTVPADNPFNPGGDFDAQKTIDQFFKNTGGPIAAQ